uniref:tRNA-specific 2-thiouridylase MnmA n=1 Tax=Thermodesulfobacterium geofontis TaxID=1295609 RepID=A0A7C4NUQ0_9BACT
MKIAVALSGGIDSAITAYILKERNYQLIGITFELFESQKETIEKAKYVAHFLNIPHHVLELKEFFKKEIISYFIDSYAKGLTPNPCAWCNRKIKFGKVLEWSIKNLKIEKFATGHYVKIENYKGKSLLKRAKDKNKDQSYFLALIDCEIIPYLIFPLGDFTKDEVKSLGKNLFKFLDYKESQDICFLKNKTLKEFLSTYLPEKRGFVVYKDEIIGTHSGIHWYTIGQRKGLGIPFGKPLYIIDLDFNENKIVLGEEKDLLSKGLILENLNFHLPLDLWTNPLAQIRYKAPIAKVKDIIKNDKEYKVLFETPVKGVTPGQICVFYEDEFLLGGGVIKKAIK